MRGDDLHPRHFPWHDPQGWAPQGSWRADAFSFASTGALASDEAKRGWVAGLHAQLEGLVEPAEDRRAAVAIAVAELRRLGHDLWSWDDDGDSELWRHDYMRATVGRGLRLFARYQPERTLGVSFGVEDSDKAKQDAREKAMADAKAKAEALAKLGGVSLGKPVTIAETQASSSVPSADKDGDFAAGNVSTPIQTGTNKVSVDIAVRWAIE